MGQYYKVCNLNKLQYLHPHRFGEGLKLLEFGCSANGTMTGLAILLADGNGRGGGDLHSEHPIIGSWAGDRIVIAGDYADEGKWDDEEGALYSAAEEPAWEDISDQVIEAMSDDSYICKSLAGRAGTWLEEDSSPALYAAKRKLKGQE